MWGEMELAYIGLESKDLAGLANYLEQHIGLVPGQPTPQGRMSWRLDGKCHRLWAQAGARSDAICLGFEVANGRAWTDALARLQALGCAPIEASAAECQERRVQHMVHVSAPWGVRVELVRGLAEADTPFQSPRYPGGFVTQGQGFGHAVFQLPHAQAYAAARRFVIEGLGMALSDWLRLPTPGGDLQVSFLHCNPRHHTLALACVPEGTPPPAAPVPTLHHINFEVASVSTVGQAYEHALCARVPMANTLGQHANDEMVSFYTVSPDGWCVEIGATGRVVGPDWDDRREYDRISQWGHQPPDALRALLG